MEEAALLRAMQRILRRVQVQPDLPRWLGVQPDEQPDQQIVERLRSGHDARVAMRRRLPGSPSSRRFSVLELASAAPRSRARSRSAPLGSALSVASDSNASRRSVS